MGRYDDIIDMEHHTSLRHPRMSLENRAAQFAPFSALTGYEDVIDETGRQTDEFVEPDPMQMQHLNEVMGMIQDRLSSRPMVSGTRFVPDVRKQGGAFSAFEGHVRNIDMESGTLVLVEGGNVPISHIVDLNWE